MMLMSQHLDSHPLSHFKLETTIKRNTNCVLAVLQHQSFVVLCPVSKVTGESWELSALMKKTSTVFFEGR